MVVVAMFAPESDEDVGGRSKPGHDAGVGPCAYLSAYGAATPGHATILGICETPIAERQSSEKAHIG